jgi:hypothetical protein
MSAFLTTPGTADVTRQAARPRTPPHNRQTTAPTDAKQVPLLHLFAPEARCTGENLEGDHILHPRTVLLCGVCTCTLFYLGRCVAGDERCRNRVTVLRRAAALIDSVAHEVQDVRECSACVSPSPPPPKPPNAPKPPCATPIDFVLVLDESGSMKKPLPECSMEGPNGLGEGLQPVLIGEPVLPRRGRDALDLAQRRLLLDLLVRARDVLERGPVGGAGPAWLVLGVLLVQLGGRRLLQVRGLVALGHAVQLDERRLLLGRGLVAIWGGVLG